MTIINQKDKYSLFNISICKKLKCLNLVENVVCREEYCLFYVQELFKSIEVRMHMFFYNLDV